MNIIYSLIAVLGVLLGIFVFIFGGYDDSPGAQLLGVLVVIASSIALVRNRKKHPSL